MFLTFTNKYIVKLIVISFFSVFAFSCTHEKTISQSPADTTNASKLIYQNPVFNHDFPDPNLVESTDGFFYAYSTQASWKNENFGGAYFLPIIRSKNLVKWEVVGDALAKKPDWKSEGGIWAPDATFYNNTYFLYYSYSTWGDPNPGIGVAASKKPEGPFTDYGKLFFSKEIGVNNSIDPFFFEEQGKPYIVWGSFNGIYGVELTADGLHVKGEKFQIGGNAYEGSFIYKKDSYYYYFGSTGSCCEGEKSTYAVKVARSATFKGPYADKEGKLLLENGGTLLLRKNPDKEGFVGPGHNGDLITDKAGQTWMIYHAFDKKQPNRRVMLLDKIEWKEGWPFINNSQPSIEPHPGPVFR
ncbi:family 43 glycosylhydrolase [Segetibacter koreensis]|uniref:family 43 glycosylhydrolase n=1 Tax=Segetibacter koreensis TaxID=398037 RepID=UPI0003A32A38|nr:family 43 glycosylhydrolase [Segetibacter koreensis]